MSASAGNVLRHVIDAITPASEAAAHAARTAASRSGSDALARMAGSLAAAQHSAVLRAGRRVLVVAIGDHGAGDPGIEMGADHPTVIAAESFADGTAAAVDLARAARAELVLVDAGAAEPRHLPALAVALGRGATHDLLEGPAQTIVDATLGLEAGIALVLSLADGDGDGNDAPLPDVLAVGALGLGSELASAALLGAALGPAASGRVELRDEDARAALGRGVALHGSSGLERLAEVGGAETAVLAGAILAAASMNIPVILDDHATGAAALVAAALAPDVTGYLIAAHRGTFTMPAILGSLGLSPFYDAGVGHGEGSGALMALALLDQAAALTVRR